MKQTKPYGRAHLTSAERAQLARTAAKPAEQQSDRPPLDSHSTPENFEPAADKRSPRTGHAAVKRTTSLRQGLANAALVIAVLVIYVLVRDSLMMVQVLEQLSSREAVMVCKDGRMHYASYNPLDRLLGKGQFVCTEWSIQRGMLSIPRPYY